MVESPSPSPSITHFLWTSGKGFIAGTFCGICETIVGHPLDTLKTRIQCASSPSLKTPPINTTSLSISQNAAKPSFITTGINIIRTDGFMALYRGFSARVMACAIANGFLFGSNGEFKRLLKFDPDIHSPLNYRFVLAGALTGVLESTVNTPVDSVKVKAQVQTTSIQDGKMVGIKKPSEIMMEIFRSGGIRTLYRGYAVTMTRDSLANGVYFTTYELCKRSLGRLEQEYWYNKPKVEGSKGHSGKYTPSQMVILISGGLAGTACWAVSYPLDTIKSIVQSQMTSEVTGETSQQSQTRKDVERGSQNNMLKENKVSHNYQQSQIVSYKGSTVISNTAPNSLPSFLNGPGMTAARTLFAEEGVTGFYRGVTPCLLRAFPTCATAFFSYEYAMAFLDEL